MSLEYEIDQLYQAMVEIRDLEMQMFCALDTNDREYGWIADYLGKILNIYQSLNYKLVGAFCSEFHERCNHVEPDDISLAKGYADALVWSLGDLLGALRYSHKTHIMSPEPRKIAEIWDAFDEIRTLIQTASQIDFCIFKYY